MNKISHNFINPILSSAFIQQVMSAPSGSKLVLPLPSRHFTALVSSSVPHHSLYLSLDMYRRVTRAMSTSRLLGNPNPQVTDAANLPVTQSLLDASHPSSASASSHAFSSSSISGFHPSSIIVSTSTSPSVSSDILQCMLDALKNQQQ